MKAKQTKKETMKIENLPTTIRLLTHNIRYATNSRFRGEEPWAVRKSRMISQLRFNTAGFPESLICLQEVLHEQLLDILAGLNADTQGEWQYIGVGRDDGKEAGEYSPIIFRPAAWNLLEFQCVWLSETPDKPSKGWDAACIRILTLGLFRHTQHQDVVIAAMNTHLDDQGSISRLESAKIIQQKVKQWPSPSSFPYAAVCLAGDFNSETHMEAYRYITETARLLDVHDLVPKENRYGHKNTFTGFKHDPAALKRIDFLFIKSDDSAGAQFAVKGYGVLENCFDDGVYNSDHRAVVADLVLLH